VRAVAAGWQSRPGFEQLYSSGNGAVGHRLQYVNTLKGSSIEFVQRFYRIGLGLVMLREDIPSCISLTAKRANVRFDSVMLRPVTLQMLSTREDRVTITASMFSVVSVR
jgi:hypothetical protein